MQSAGSSWRKKSASCRTRVRRCQLLLWTSGAVKSQPVTSKRGRRRRDMGRAPVGTIQSVRNMHTDQGVSRRGQPVALCLQVYSVPFHVQVQVHRCHSLPYLIVPIRNLTGAGVFSTVVDAILPPRAHTNYGAAYLWYRRCNTVQASGSGSGPVGVEYEHGCMRFAPYHVLVTRCAPVPLGPGKSGGSHAGRSRAQLCVARRLTVVGVTAA